MLIAFWGIKGRGHVNWLPKNVRINTVYFRDEILRSISQKLQTNVAGGHKSWTVVRIDKAKVHTAKVISSSMPDLRLKRTFQPPYSPDISPSDFFLFGWLKGKLQPL
jgi:transposase